MNKVFITGRITRDIELRKTQQNKSVVSFSIAVDKGTKDANGNKEVIFIDIQAWERTADFLSQYAGKGVLIGVDGKLETYSGMNQQGQRYIKTYVVANHVEILNRPQNNQPQQSNQQASVNQPVNNYSPNEAVSNYSIDGFKDDDLPFM